MNVVQMEVRSPAVPSDVTALCGVSQDLSRTFGVAHQGHHCQQVLPATLCR